MAEGQYVYPETPKRPGGYPRPSAEDRTRALDLLLVDRIAQAEHEAPAGLVSWASRSAVDYLRGANQQLKRRSHGRLSSWLAAVKSELHTNAGLHPHRSRGAPKVAFVLATLRLSACACRRVRTFSAFLAAARSDASWPRLRDEHDLRQHDPLTRRRVLPGRNPHPCAPSHCGNERRSSQFRAWASS